MQIGLQAFMPVQKEVSSVFFIRIFDVYPCIWSNFYSILKITLSRISIKNKIFMVERQMAQTWDRSYEHLTLNASMRYP